MTKKTWGLEGFATREDEQYWRDNAEPCDVDGCLEPSDYAGGNYCIEHEYYR